MTALDLDSLLMMLRSGILCPVLTCLIPFMVVTGALLAWFASVYSRNVYWGKSLMRKTDWITLDYLEFFCEQKSLVIHCTREGEEVWISPLGPHPSSLTSDEIQQILRESAQFELRKTADQDSDITLSEFLTRAELEQQIRLLMN